VHQIDHRWTGWVAIIGCVVLATALAALVPLGDLRARPQPAILLIMLAGLGYVAAVGSLARTWRRLAAPARRRWVAAIIVVGLAIRMVLFFVPPTLSDDIYRYRWDGRVQAHELNPYSEPPGASSLEPLRDELWESINYPRIRSIYPPLAQRLFAAAYGLGDTLMPFKALAVLGDLIVLMLLLALVRFWQLPGWTLATYALHPLPAIEYASSGHFDAWVAAAVLGAVLLHVRGRALASTLALAVGVLLKTWPVILVPVFLRHRAWWHGPAVLGVLLAGYLPFLDAGTSMLQPWLDYTGRWRFNDGAYFVLRHLGGSLEAGKALAAVIGAGLFLWLWRRREDPVRAGYWLLLAFIALMPTVHPWYMLWALPLAAIAVDLGWIALCLTAPLAYWILVGAAIDSNVWVEPWWPRAVEYLPAAAIWVWQARRFGAPAPGRTEGVVSWLEGADRR
jgi:hypothetical protein